MKSAVNKGGPVPTPVLSHIPLPRRKSSGKSEKGLEPNDTDSELGGDNRSHTKTSFCCVSGQKEDYLPDAKIPPPRKNNTPLAPPVKALMRNRRGRIIESNSEDAISQSSETRLMKQSPEDIKIRPLGDSRLRPPDQKGRIPPSSPHRKISRDPKNSEAKKPSETNRKLRKDLSPRVVAKDLGGSRKSKDTVHSNPREESDCDNVFHPSDEPLENTPNHGVYRASGTTEEELMDSIRSDDNGVMKDDFDCPCCDSTSTLADGPMSDAEIHVFTTCEVLPHPAPQHEKERALRLEIEALKGDLQSRLSSHRDRVQLLEEELAMMTPLKNELEKEKELRKIAEDKLLQVLDHERRNEKRTESKGTQKDDTDVDASGNSPLIMGYESRVRRYQNYITKLEKDNLTLVNELKKFRDMRLEEECKVLHLRVEQLEQENGTLMELIDDNENENMVKSPTEEEINSKVQNKLPLHHPVTSSAVKKMCTTRKPSISSDERISEPPKIPNACSEPKSPVSKPGCTSKIPAFSSPAVVFKKNRNESKTRNEIHPSPVPNLKSRTQTPAYSESPKGKRKRLSKNAAATERDSKQRLKTRWEPRRTVPGRHHQQVWSFSCEVAVPESSGKIADAFQEKDPPASSRTRDEGYSTMSSDLQPDSSANEPSAARELRCVSDDSVTECLDGSMCSSSDSGFGPLHQVANSKSAANISTVRHKERIVRPPTQSADGVKELCNTTSSAIFDTFVIKSDPTESVDASALDHPSVVNVTCLPKKSSLDRVETAEKATLTEPEERLWREKALAPFIDESIWSLYSSEGEPLVVVTGEEAELERVASDTVLYLKDAAYELEHSMHRGLDDNSGGDSDSGNGRLVWPSPTRSSSTGSSTSLQVVSDELEDVDLLTESREGSQDLSSASDAEGESLEHKDFVERWLQNEVASKMAVGECGSNEDLKEAKEFNGDFYKLCSVGSLRSLDHFAPSESAGSEQKVSQKPTLTSLPADEPKMKAVFKPRRQDIQRDELKEGCGTAWIHLQAKPELGDPMARVSLLNSVTSSSSEEEEIFVIHTSSHLHRICRERRQKVKASANNPSFEGKRRSSVMGRHELFYRFGDKEKEAIACFDFLEELPTSDSFLPSPCRRWRLPNLWNQPLSRNVSEDCELLDHISLSDSCAESYSSSTPDSYEDTS